MIVGRMFASCLQPDGKARLRGRGLVIAVLAAGTIGATGESAVAQGTGGCDRFAAPGGSDAATGSRSSPFGTMQELADSLSAGEVGCLREGVYEEADVEIGRGGTEGRPLTLRSYPGERARLVGRLWITDQADHVTISNLDLDGSGAPPCPDGGTCELQPSPVVNGDHATFVDNDVTNRNSAICFTLGSGSYGRAVGTRITGNSIHHCGRLPATNYDHGIYVSHADETEIVGNLIYANADRGVQLYPDAQRTRIAFNVINGNGTGVQFSGEDGVASNDNVVERNLITNAELADVTSWYSGERIGERNTVRKNCVSSLEEPGEESGYTVEENLVADPLYADAEAADFRLAPNSPCLRLTGDIASAVTGGGPVRHPIETGSSAALTILVDLFDGLFRRLGLAAR